MSTQQKIPVNIEDEMKRSYMDYAMSVIIGRALPDVRDGLKPAHRRVLFAMRALGLHANRGYRKCAGIVGEVIGKYHPHGDAAAYDTLVRLAQDFNMRYPLVDGQGNFGSMDGDNAAAYRYTEAKLEKLADELMADLDNETVDFAPTFDEQFSEPLVLPAPYPNLLVNGSSGIAVGMATNIPPHNLGEIINAVVSVIELNERTDAYAQANANANASGNADTSESTGARADVSADADQEASDATMSAADIRLEKQRLILKAVPGPDFPTAALIVGRAGIHSAYTTGRGSIMLRARTEIENIPKSNDRQQIVVSEVPYQVNKAALVAKIGELVREKVIEGIADLRDESDRDGVRVVIELKRGEMPDVVLNNLFKHTQLQTTFGVIMLAIVGGRPRVLPMVDLIDYFIEFRLDVVRRRTEFELRKAEARFHILEGLRIALDHLDAVIQLIRASKNPGEAREGLMAQFGLTQIQSQAILDMQLQRLTGLERQKILDELADVTATINRLRGILSSRKLLMGIVVRELRAIQEKYSDARRTEIIDDPGEIRIEDLIAEEDVAITVSSTGYIKRTSLSTYRSQRRGGKGRSGMGLKEDDIVSHLFVASTHAYILIFSDRGRAYWLKVYEIPDVGPANKGKAIANLVSMEPGEKIAALLAVREWPQQDDQQFIVMGTRKGIIKKTDLRAYANPRAGGIIAMGVEDDDAVIAVQNTDGNHEVLIGTREGQSIRFRETDVRPMGRTAYGVKGIELRENDEVVAMETVKPGGLVLTVTANGYGKRTDLDEYRLQTRGGYGIINIQTSDRNGRVVGIAYVSGNDQLMLITQQGQILRIDTGSIRIIGRATQGVRLIDLNENDQVGSIVRVADQNGDEPNGGPDADPEGGNGDATATPEAQASDEPQGDDEQG
jgi:DNA gyrase subunit A